MIKYILQSILLFCLAIASTLNAIFCLSFFNSNPVLRFLVNFNFIAGPISSYVFGISLALCFGAVAATRVLTLKSIYLFPRFAIIIFFMILFNAGAFYVGERFCDQPVQLQESNKQLKIFEGDSWKDVKPEQADILQRVASRRFSSSLAVSILLTALIPIAICGGKRSHLIVRPSTANS